MSTAPSRPDVGGDSGSGRDPVDQSLDEALRQAVDTLESPAYQGGDPAFDPLTPRDAVLLAGAYIALPALFAIAVWLL